MRKGTHNALAIGAGLLACLLVIGGSIIYRNLAVLFDNSSWVAHTREVQTGLESLLSRVVDAENSQRGYVITGDDVFLKAYRAARYQEIIDKLVKLTADNQSQQENLHHLEQLADTRYDEMQMVLDTYSRQGFEAAKDLINENRTHQVMSVIRSTIETMQREERELLDARDRDNQVAFRTARITVVLAIIAGLIGVAAFWGLLQTHLRSVDAAAMALYEQREMLQAMLVSIGDGVIATDQQSRITLSNVVAQKLTGWRESDAIGRHLNEVFRIFNEETREPAENPAERALREGQIVGLANHTILIAKDGTEWPLDDSAAPIRTVEGKIAGAILVFREITERKLNEQQLVEQAAALEEADHRKDEFLATLAHELRNPLSPISNALQIWPFVEDNRSELDRLRMLMMRQVQQMTRLIDDLMDVSRITSGKIRLHKQAVDLIAIINSVVEETKPLIDARSQNLALALPNIPLLVEGDTARLTQIVGNILNNAVKYTGRGGVIWVSAEAPDGQVLFRVRDNGVGIPSHMLTAIFEMFRQADSSLERAHGGLGIGLTLVKRLIDEHGGTVEARSEGPGKGSEFIVTLPLAKDQDGRPAGEPRYQLQQIAGLTARRILVVDDVKASAHTLAMMLRALGQEVSEAHDGPSAIEQALTIRPAIIFLDIAMPGMSGYDVARHLRNQMPNVVLVALTGYGQEEDRRRVLEAGFNHHFVKPTSIDALQELLLTTSAP